MALQLIPQRQVEGLGSNASLFEQMANLSKPWVMEVTVSTTSAGQTFTLTTAYPTDGKTLKVFYNGQLQKPGGAYVEVDTRTVQFPDMIYKDDIIVFRIEGAGSGTAFVSDHAHVYGEYMSGVQDNINTVFTTTRSSILGSERPYVNGVRQYEGDDYSASAAATPTYTTITFVKAPSPTDKIIIDYDYAIKP